MAPEDILDVERSGAVAFGHARHIAGRDEQEDCGGIDEAADQPRAGDAVHLGPSSGDPKGNAGRVSLR